MASRPFGTVLVELEKLPDLPGGGNKHTFLQLSILNIKELFKLCLCLSELSVTLNFIEPLGSRSGLTGTNSNPLSSSSTMSAIGAAANGIGTIPVPSTSSSNNTTSASPQATATTLQAGPVASTNSTSVAASGGSGEETKTNHARRRRKVSCRTC